MRKKQTATAPARTAAAPSTPQELYPNSDPITNLMQGRRVRYHQPQKDVFKAMEIAAERKRRMDAWRKPEDVIGNAAVSLNADVLGVRGEAIAIRWLKDKKQRPEKKLLALRPVKGPDIWLDGCTYDVKSARPGAQRVTINLSAHQAHRSQYYLVVLFQNDHDAIILPPISHHDVDEKWERIEDRGHSPHLSCPVVDLLPKGGFRA